MVRSCRQRRGANAIEFALLFPVFVWLFTAIVDYGWLFMAYIVATSAVHEGARAGALTLKANDPAATATKTVTDRIDSAAIDLPTPKITSTLGGTAPDGYISVSVQLTLTPLVGLVPLPHAINASTVMRLEDQS